MAKWPDTRPTVDADGWTRQYGCYSKRFGRFLVEVSPSMDREKPGYVVRVVDQTLTKLSPDVEDGKRRGTSWLRRQLELALAELPEFDSVPEFNSGRKKGR